MATHSSIIVWSIPWTEEPQSIGSQRVRHDWSDLACTHTWVSLGCMENTLGSPPRFYDLQVQLIPQLLWVLAARDSQLLTASWELLYSGSYKLPTTLPPTLGSPQSTTDGYSQWLMDKPMTGAKAWPLCLKADSLCNVINASELPMGSDWR